MRRLCRLLLVLTAAAILPLSGSAGAEEPPAAAKGKLTKPPKLLEFVEAPFPEVEKEKGLSASVTLRVAIGPDGAVLEAAVVESPSPAFAEAALAAVRRFRFEPAEIDGVPAPVRILYRYEFTFRQEAPTDSFFEGLVRDRDSKAPLPGVTLELDTGERVVTDADGRFRLDHVAPGTHGVTLTGEGMTAQLTQELFEAGKRVTATYDVGRVAPADPDEPADDMEIVVTAPPLEKQVVSTAVSASEGQRIPGTQGDVLKVVENLPGVARSAAGSGQLVVWGAAPEDTRVYVDGVPLPRLYHDGGLRSVMSSDLVESVELVPGGYGVAHGRGLGGIVLVGMRPLEEGFHGRLQADLLGASASVRGDVGAGVRGALAFRGSYLDQLLPLLSDEEPGELFPLPRFYDGQARVGMSLTPRSSVEVGTFVSSDATLREVASKDPSDRKSEEKSLRFFRVYGRYEAQSDEGGELELTPFVGRDVARVSRVFAATPALLEQTTWTYGARAAYRVKVLPDVVATAGLDGEVRATSARREGSVTSPPREGDASVFGSPPSSSINADSWDTVIGSLAPHGEVDVALWGGSVHVVSGLRLDPYFVDVSRKTPVVGDTPSIGLTTEDMVLEPRLSITWAPDERTTLRAATGLYHQAPQAEDLSAVFGNPTLGTARAVHWLAGAEVEPFPLFSVEVTGFYSSSEGLASRSASSSPALAGGLVAEGEGRAYGVELLVRKEPSDGLFGWASYSLLRSERRDHPDERFRLFDYDQTHLFTALASYEVGWGVEVGARFRLATGMPRTPVRDAYFDARTGRYEPLFGEKNTRRIGTFYQLDARVAKRFTLSPSAALLVYADVQNVTNRENPEEIVYSRDFTSEGTIRGVPLLPLVGAELSW